MKNALQKSLCASASLTFAMTGATSASATIIAFTSFEEPAFESGAYTDLDTTDHELSNNAGEPIVQYTAGSTAPGAELGFRSFLSDVRASSTGNGLDDGDFIGVKTTSTNLTEAYPDGVQGYRFQDPDGTLTLQLDTVDLTAFSVDPTLTVSVNYFLNETSWETSDFFRIWVEVDGGFEIDLASSVGLDIDDLVIEGSFNEVTASLTGYTTATLRAELSSNSSAEEMWVDQIEFSVIPEPASLVLIGLGGVAMLSRRRG